MNEDGKWITINGAHVFLKEGQSPMDAFVRQKTQKKEITQEDINEYKNSAPDDAIAEFADDFGITEEEAEKILYGGKEDTSKNQSGEQTFSKEDVEIIEDYQLGDEYDYINGYLRGTLRTELNENAKEGIEKEIKSLDKATNKQLGEDKTLYRVVDKNMYLKNGDYKDLINKEFTEKGFMSTSTDIKAVEDFADGGISPGERIYLEIKAPKDTKGADFSKINDPSFRNTQKEVLLTRNTKYEIYNAEEKEGKIWLYAKIKKGVD